MVTMFPGFDTLPAKEEKTVTKQKPQYYIRVRAADGWYFLWKTHTNGGCEWRSESELGKKSPLRYKTLTGAKRQLWSYTHSNESVLERAVGVWG